MEMKFIPKKEFDRVQQDLKIPIETRLELLSTMCRLNTLFEVKRAGSGHLGTSFSAMDIVAFLYFHYMNVTKLGIDNPDRDIYFSSKGHDVPGLYAVLYALGIVPEERFLALRRLGGLDGHPDVKIPGIEANTGSLGMGISKGRGMAFAKKFLNRKGKVIVLTGDGEWQEGQNFEALQSTVQQKRNDVMVVVDHNKLQSDRLIDRIVSLGDFENKVRSFGWWTKTIDGHDYKALAEAFTEAESIQDRPKFLICDTIKGKGVSFMEHPYELEANKGFYRWHSGAPDDASYEKAYSELKTKVLRQFEAVNLPAPSFTEPQPEPKVSAKMSGEVIAVDYGQSLFKQAKTNKNFIVLDADLSFDCKLREFEDTYPERFVECGIAEQDMVSMAAGIAAQGLTPIVHSFANFLAARANEQIYNALTENRKIIFSCHYAGLIPAGPGKSHQSIRDISLFGAFPNCEIVQACSGKEVEMLVDYALNQTKQSVMMRVNIGPSPRVIPLPDSYLVKHGQGCVLTEGKEHVLFSYGPVMLHESLLAAEILREKGLSLKVVNMPFLNRFDLTWLKETLQGCSNLYVVEDHSPVGGLGDRLLDTLNKNGMTKALRFETFGVEGYPACGTPWQVLEHHKLSGAALAERIMK